MVILLYVIWDAALMSPFYDYYCILPLEHDHGQTDSRARAQRLSAALHKATW